jgi:hypothetical protein
MPRKRPLEEDLEEEKEEALEDDAATSASPFATRQLRGRRVEVFERSTRRRGIGRDNERIIYTAAPGPRASHGRSSMSASLTDTMIEESQSGPVSPYAMRIQPLEGGRVRMKTENVSRNHILADSRIRIILLDARDALNARDRQGIGASSSSGRPADEEALNGFLRALAGEEEGDDLYRRFQEARVRRNVRRFNDVMDEACVGVRNLRFGEARTNGQVLNQLDPVVINGRPSLETEQIMDAVIRLAATGLISAERALDALAVAKDRTTWQDVTSSAFDANGAVSTRVRAIDYFRGPSALASRPRSNSVSYPPTASPQPYREWAREFDYTSRAFESSSSSPFASSSSGAADASSSSGLGGLDAPMSSPFDPPGAPSSSLDSADVEMKEAELD